MTPSPETICRSTSTISARRCRTASSGAGIFIEGFRRIWRRSAQPWRALYRGLTLLMMNARPLRRTMRQFLSRFFSDFSELTIFMPLSLDEGRNIGTGPGEVKPGRLNGGVLDSPAELPAGPGPGEALLAATQLSDVVTAGQESSDVARRLAQALTVLDEGDTDEPLAIFAKADPRRNCDISALEQELREGEAADRLKGRRDRCPREHCRLGFGDLPTGLAQAVDQHVTTGAVALASFGDAVLRTV